MAAWITAFEVADVIHASNQVMLPQGHQWIPVAAGAVLSTSREALEIFVDLEIPILAIYGDQDAKGKDSSNRLAGEAGAWTLELEGRHPCYLDSPNEFIRAVIDFIDNGGRVSTKRHR